LRPKVYRAYEIHARTESGQCRTWARDPQEFNAQAKTLALVRSAQCPK